ncbi:MAG TPA: DinB family protein [Longimicrobium sp.]|nr:DinB family protein [Longimicrobium sp.]
MPHAHLTFVEIRQYTAAETERWHQWLREAGPAALEIRVGEGDRATVREVIHHIFAVERRYADRLHGAPVTGYDAIPREPLDALFRAGREARSELARFAEHASPDDWARVLTFETITAGTFTASTRKIVAHALMHGIRHWAQIATALRGAGHPQPWGHDLLMSDALD